MSQDIKRVTLGDVQLAIANLELGLRWLHDRTQGCDRIILVPRDCAGCKVMVLAMLDEDDPVYCSECAPSSDETRS